MAIIWLIIKGYKIHSRRYKTYLGEIDIIALKAKQLVFVEVKARTARENLGEVLPPYQCQRIKNAALLFLQSYPQFASYHGRFDLIKLNKWFLPIHIKNAWQ